jgi:hypothetical protein
MKTLNFIIYFFFFCSFLGFSQDTVPVPDAPKETSPIRSLTDQEYLDYKYGNEMGMGRVAELNNYPSPEEVRKHEDKLKLTVAQKAQLKKIIDGWIFKTREMGGFILTQESRLNNLFATGKATDGAVIYFTNKIGLYLGELRNAHLQAHLKTRSILTPDQIRKYYQIKGMTK